MLLFAIRPILISCFLYKQIHTTRNDLNKIDRPERTTGTWQVVRVIKAIAELYDDVMEMCSSMLALYVGIHRSPRDSMYIWPVMWSVDDFFRRWFK